MVDEIRSIHKPSYHSRHAGLLLVSRKKYLVNYAANAEGVPAKEVYLHSIAQSRKQFILLHLQV